MQSMKVRFQDQLFVHDSFLCLQAQGSHVPWHDILASPVAKAGSTWSRIKVSVNRHGGPGRPADGQLAAGIGAGLDGILAHAASLT
jgi:hypothetical protein